jgi:hypothetical protein
MKTIDLDLAQELQSVCKEKNIEIPESAHRWVYIGTKWYLYTGQEFLETQIRNSDVELIATNAYTLDELLEWLPNKIEKGTTTYFKTLLHNYNKEYLAYYDDSNCGYIPSTSFFQFDPNPANAACKLLIWLIKEGLI